MELQNLGNAINTEGRESFPFIAENELYFASNGHLDLEFRYICVKSRTGWKF
jgi:hypothetical protein